jgi:hypothetical protein
MAHTIHTPDAITARPTDRPARLWVAQREFCSQDCKILTLGEARASGDSVVLIGRSLRERTFPIVLRIAVVMREE